MATQVTQSDPVILLTRPERQSNAFATGLHGLGARVVISPIQRIAPLADWVPPDPDDTLIFTSRNGVETAALGLSLTGRHCHVVGQKTADYARSLGLKVGCVAETANALGDAIMATGEKDSLCHLHGRHTTGDLSGRLRKAGLQVSSAVTYDQVPCPLTVEAKAALSEPGHVILPLFSPRSARLLADAVSEPSAKASLHLVSISPSTDAAWTGPVAASRCHADTANAASMMESIRSVVSALT